MYTPKLARANSARRKPTKEQWRCGGRLAWDMAVAAKQFDFTEDWQQQTETTAIAARDTQST
jgi:hypothetical protein